MEATFEIYEINLSGEKGKYIGKTPIEEQAWGVCVENAKHTGKNTAYHDKAARLLRGSTPEGTYFDVDD